MRMRHLLLALAAAASTAAGQQFRLQPPPQPDPDRPIPVAGANNPTYVPVNVSADHTLTLRIQAPSATAAQVLVGDVGFDTAYPMDRDAKGVWTAAIGPMPPDIYRYTFLIGGARVNGGYATVPGSPPAVWEVQDVPHGALVTHIFHSKAQRRERTLQVYLPAAYQADPRRRFPVFYMWKPGEGDDIFFTAARPQVMMDNLIAARRAVPMIVVMPGIDVPPTMSMGSPEARNMLERELVDEIMPFVQARYRTRDGRANRAISGISQSGATAFVVGMRHLDLFGSVGEFGTGFFGGLLNPPGYTSYLPYSPDAVTPDMHTKLRAPTTRLRLLYMSAGTVDPRMPFQRKAADTFRADGIAVTFETFAGGHEYAVWRRSFASMASLLFKQEK